MMELRLTVGEIAFAVGVVSTIDRALGIVRDQLDAREPERAKMALAASGQSLLARELASYTEREVKLAPALQSAAEVIAGAEWLLRCVRVAGKRTEQLNFHIAPSGVMVQTVEGMVVHRVAPIGGVSALIDRAAGFFGLPPLDQAAGPASIDRQSLAELGQLPRSADIGRELVVRGVPEALSRLFATDLANVSWKGAVSLDHTPKDRPATSQAALVLIAGARRWLIDTRAPDAAILAEASRQRFAAALIDILRSLDGTTRKFDRAGELDR